MIRVQACQGFTKVNLSDTLSQNKKDWNKAQWKGTSQHEVLDSIPSIKKGGQRKGGERNRRERGANQFVFVFLNESESSSHSDILTYLPSGMIYLLSSCWEWYRKANSSQLSVLFLQELPGSQLSCLPKSPSPDDYSKHGLKGITLDSKLGHL